MKLIVINGSPRGRKSNTKILLDYFMQGFLSIKGNEVKTIYLNNKEYDIDVRRAIIHSEAILLAFPLYNDFMPAIVKGYFELLERYKAVNPGIKFGFLVQSGFPESYHSFFVARYLKIQSQKLEADYLGTIIKGGIEGIQVKPAWMTARIRKMLYKTGALFGKYGRFDKQLMKKLARPIRYKWVHVLSYRLISWLGLSNYYWNMQLRENNAFDKRNSRPCIENY